MLKRKFVELTTDNTLQQHILSLDRCMVQMEDELQRKRRRMH